MIMRKFLFLVLYAAIALLLAGSFVSCNKMVDELDTDPEKAILGKWELVLLTRNVGDEIQHTPTGYVEYLPGGRFGWYDYATKEYTLYEGKYWVENIVWTPESDYDTDTDCCILHYENSLIKCEDVSPCYECGDELWCYKYIYHRDRPIGFNFTLNFQNQNTISLYCLDVMFITSDYDYVYKRKK